MPLASYPQFCAVARAAEMLGERWTLLIVRELLLGPKRFTDLKGRLDGISTSVLSGRLGRLEEEGLLRRVSLPPPAASTVYELTEAGAALRPVVFELIRWGALFLFPRRPGERAEPEWLRLALGAYARRTGAPGVSFELRIRDGSYESVLYVRGGAGGTTVGDTPQPTDVAITADVETVLGLMSGLLEPSAALKEGRIQVEGDAAALSAFPQLFDARREVDVGTA